MIVADSALFAIVTIVGIYGLAVAGTGAAALFLWAIGYFDEKKTQG